MKTIEITQLIGKIFTSIENINNDELVIKTTSGDQYKFWHDQDCCESVQIDDIVGDLNDLIGSPIIMSECIESGGEGAKEKYDDSYTWTFYKLATIKGYVTIKWYGTSNGYYSEGVSFSKIN